MPLTYPPLKRYSSYLFSNFQLGRRVLAFAYKHFPDILLIGAFLQLTAASLGCFPTFLTDNFTNAVGIFRDREVH